jgi:hypothetical protein
VDADIKEPVQQQWFNLGDLHGGSSFAQRSFGHRPSGVQPAPPVE